LGSISEAVLGFPVVELVETSFRPPVVVSTASITGELPSPYAILTGSICGSCAWENGSGGDAQERKALSVDELETEPPIVASLFGAQVETARMFARDLALRGEELGLIGPVEAQRLWTRHIVNSVLAAPLLYPGLVGDVGSGAGLPGLVLAIARPDVDFILIEPMERRVAWLLEESERLGLGNVTVLRARAEEAQPPRPLDQVTARAVSALSKLIPLCVPLVKTGGELLFFKGSSVDSEVAAAAKVIRRHHLSEVEIVLLGDGMATEVTRVFRAKVD
jgi:16S rRNA (guanine527-N7)-methyltransferase